MKNLLEKTTFKYSRSLWEDNRDTQKKIYSEHRFLPAAVLYTLATLRDLAVSPIGFIMDCAVTLSRDPIKTQAAIASFFETAKKNAS